MLTRRNLMTGLVATVAAPAIVRIDNIMPVRSIVMDDGPWSPYQVGDIIDVMFDYGDSAIYTFKNGVWDRSRNIIRSSDWTTTIRRSRRLNAIRIGGVGDDSAD